MNTALNNLNRHSFLWLLGIGVGVSVMARLLIEYTSFTSDAAWLKNYGGSTMAILVCLVCMIVYYGMAQQDANESHQSHQPENLYYMGLLFTLSSLVYSLITLFIFSGIDDDISARVYNLIGSFGIALISTFFGILFRILLLQKLDPIITGVGARIPDRGGVGEETLHGQGQGQGQGQEYGLTEAAFRLRQELTQTIADMSVFRKNIIQATDETVRDADKARAAMMQRVSDATDEQVKIFAALIKNVQKPLEELAAEQTTRLQQAISLAERSANHLEQSVQNSAIKITEGGGKIEVAFNALLEPLQNILRNMQSTSQGTHDLTAEYDALSARLQQSAALFTTVGDEIKQSAETLTVTTKALSMSLTEATQVMPQYAEEFAQLIAGLRKEAEKWQSMTQEVRSSLVQAVEDLTKIVKQ